MSSLAIIGCLIVAFLAGVDGILDEWSFQQPIVAGTLMGVVTGDISAGILLGSSLQMVTLGWMNIGAAVSPDVALAVVAPAYLVCGPAQLPLAVGVALAIPFALIGQGLTVLVRRLVSRLVHRVERDVAAGHLERVTQGHLLSLVLQGLRVMVPVALLLCIPTSLIQSLMGDVPSLVTNGLAVAEGFIAVVGYAMVIQMMATKQLWPFFFLGFALAAVKGLSMLSLGMIGLAIAIIVVSYSSQQQPPQTGSGDDDLDDLDRELEDL